jgi:hypothetical protein
MSLETLGVKFKENLLEFLEELVVEFPKEGDLIVLKMLLQELDSKYIIQNFIKDILPLSDHVKSRNDSFFLENQIFPLDSKISSEKTNHFKRVWQNNTDEETKQTIWEWFDVLIHLAQLYQNKQIN